MKKTSCKPIKTDPLYPSVTLLVKLGSIVVHTDEALGSNGHPLDVEAMRPLLSDLEVQTWIKDMGVYLPLKRQR